MRVGPYIIARRYSYGRQSSKATITDAHLVLGRLNPDYFSGGSMAADVAGARHAMGLIAERLGVGIAQAALGMLQVTESNMARAIREIAITKGQDVREFTLLGFGGGGALHACNLADELDIDTIVVPEDAGLLSAHGLLIADIKIELSATRVSRATATTDSDLMAIFNRLEADARRKFAGDGLDPSLVVIRRSIDMRYVGQAYEINVPLPDATDGIVRAGVDAFHDAHARLYWWKDPDREIEFVTPRVTAIFDVPKLPVVRSALSGADADAALKGMRGVLFTASGPTPTAIYDRDRLLPGNRLSGPAIVESFDTTLVVNPGFQATMNAFRHLVVTREPR